MQLKALIAPVLMQGVGNLAPYSFFNIMSCDPVSAETGCQLHANTPGNDLLDPLSEIRELEHAHENDVAALYTTGSGAIACPAPFLLLPCVSCVPFLRSPMFALGH